ncbi:predicted protein, partial [Nematostella vectensis]
IAQSVVLSKPFEAQSDEKVFRFANLYGNHMVLQQAPHRATVWGYGEPGQIVKITLAPEHMMNSKTIYKTSVSKACDAGVWKVALEPQKAGGPYTVHASSVVNGSAVESLLSDVLFGDVWVCSGQSNMDFSITQTNNPKEAAAEANHYLHIRLFTAERFNSTSPLYELKAIRQLWSVASSASINGGAWKYFSAVCWFYGKNLFDRLQYPIGLISTTWGGTAIEEWSSPDSLAKCGIQSFDSSKEKTLGPFPNGGSGLYNGMVHPFLNISIYGVIWYQGESNSGAPQTYNCTFPAMIEDWRRKWFSGTSHDTDPEFPFGFVQLSSYTSDPTLIDGFPAIRWAQTADQGYVPNSSMRNVFMAVAMDLGNATSPYGSIHPTDKRDVGFRLALAGRAIAYGEPGVYHTGPLIVEVKSHASSKDGWGVELAYTNLFCKSSSKWLPAKITESAFYTVSLQGVCPAGPGDVTAVRYAWRTDPCDFKKCAVYSKAEELPAGPYMKYAPF